MIEAIASFAKTRDVLPELGEVGLLFIQMELNQFNAIQSQANNQALFVNRNSFCQSFPFPSTKFHSFQTLSLLTQFLRLIWDLIHLPCQLLMA